MENLKNPNLAYFIENNLTHGRGYNHQVNFSSNRDCYDTVSEEDIKNNPRGLEFCLAEMNFNKDIKALSDKYEGKFLGKLAVKIGAFIISERNDILKEKAIDRALMDYEEEFDNSISSTPEGLHYTENLFKV